MINIKESQHTVYQQYEHEYMVVTYFEGFHKQTWTPFLSCSHRDTTT